MFDMNEKVPFLIFKVKMLLLLCPRLGIVFVDKTKVSASTGNSSSL
ncbi:hypothetical protein T190115A13A_110058 [Tenacibaculum sp. 190524A02b]|uniref:Uncharacterized protein n=1 Tax=Tenacibaculum vairaonense TaxID=3137860 RepID=A0ABM9PH60_9FLAO